MNTKDYFLGILIFLLVASGVVYYYREIQEHYSYKPLKIIDLQATSPVALKIKVGGAVNTSGDVYITQRPARLIDVIKASGGLSPYANSKNINLAEDVENSLYIDFPFYFQDEVRHIKKPPPVKKTKKAKKAKINKSKKTAGKKTRKSSKKKEALPTNYTININTAPQKELMKLPGIGETLSERIIEQRKKKPFKNFDDVLAVKGIGKKTLENLQPYITF
jgi:competence ComEA-like helix-hairpin-helix protein